MKTVKIILLVLVLIELGLFCAIKYEEKQMADYGKCVESSDYTDSALDGCAIKYNRNN